MDNWIDIRITQGEVMMRQGLAQAEELRRSSAVEERKLLEKRQDFQAIKNKLLTRGPDAENPMLAFREFGSEVVRLKSSRASINEQIKKLSGIEGKRREVAAALKTESSRISRLEELSQEVSTRAIKTKEGLDFETQIEAHLAARVFSRSRVDGQGETDSRLSRAADAENNRAEDSCTAIQGDSEVREQPMVNVSGTAPVDIGAVQFQLSSQGRASQGHSGHQGGERGPEEQPQSAFNQQHQEKIKSALEYTEKMEAVRGWENSSGAGVELTWVKDDGARLDISMQSLPAQKLNIEIAPEKEADRNRLQDSRADFTTALQREGLKVENLNIRLRAGGQGR